MVGHTVPHMLRFAVLGPLRVWRNGTELYVGPVQQRIVLAVLLLRANRPVSPEDLIAAVWGETPPERAVDLLRRHVAGLRRMLEPGRPVGAPSRLLVRTEAGYVLTVPSGQLDLEVFDAQVARGRAARVAGDLPAAARALHEALGLWRGRFCEGLLSPLLSGGREALEEYRLDVLEERFEIDLTLGRHAEAVAEPAGTVRGHPLRERLYARQAPAPYRPGERAEAPSGYRRDRNSGPEPFADEGDTGFGGGPGAQRLHRAGLTVDPAFAPSTPEATPPDRRPATVPCLLPGDVAGFTGRERQLAWLHRLATPDGTSTASVICLISGAPGVGKTALAVHWAHRVRPAFPDGQLYLNLRGYDPEQPMPAGEALARLLTALGLPGEDIPLDVNDRSARYRSELAGRHVLVVLDNAATAEQVRPLLPGTPTCLTVVTSRDALPGLVALDGAHRLVLGLLPTGDTHALLRRLIGPRVRAEPQAAATLANLCRRLPLALRLAAELAAARPHHSLAGLATELADRQRRLDLLDADQDPNAGVRGVFSWSYQRLPADTARAFRLLALHPGTDWDPYATAALTGTTTDAARRLLDQLARAHLVQPTGPGRFTMHDLLRAYAAELTATTDPEPDRHAALTRLFDHYLATTTAATTTLGLLSVDRRPRLLRIRQVAPAPPVGDPEAARTWLGAERANLVAVCAHATEHGWQAHAITLATTLFTFLAAGGRYTEILTLHGHACRAARDSDDVHSEAYLLTNLGFVHWRRGCYQNALEHHRSALNRFHQVDDRPGRAYALFSAGLVLWRQGEYRQAAEHLRKALDVFEQLGDRRSQSKTWTVLGLICLRQGDDKRAAEYEHRALDLSERLGDVLCKAYALTHLGLVHCSRGDHQRAVECHRQSHDLARQLGHRTAEAEALNGLGEALRASGQAVMAGARHADALALAEQVGERYEQARAHRGIAVTRHTMGDLERARRHWENALHLYTSLGVPEATAVHAQLTALAHETVTPGTPEKKERPT